MSAALQTQSFDFYIFYVTAGKGQAATYSTVAFPSNTFSSNTVPIA